MSSGATPICARFERVRRLRARDGRAPRIAARRLLPPALPGFERLVYVDGVRSGLRQPRARRRARLQCRCRRPRDWLPEQRLGLLCDMFASDAAAPAHRGRCRASRCCSSTAARSRGHASTRGCSSRSSRAASCSWSSATWAPARTASLVCAMNVAIELARGARSDCTTGCSSAAATPSSSTPWRRRSPSAPRYRVRQVADRRRQRAHQCARAARRPRRDPELAGASPSAAASRCTISSLKVEHAAPDTRTEEMFRGIADERARVAFSGHIHIAARAPGAEARQSLRGLIEGAAAEIDLRPRLEINTDDVRAAARRHHRRARREPAVLPAGARHRSPDRAHRCSSGPSSAMCCAQIELPALRARSRATAPPASCRTYADRSPGMSARSAAPIAPLVLDPELSTSRACAPTSRSWRGPSTAGRWCTWTAPPPRSGRARCCARWSTTRRICTPTCIAACTPSASGPPTPTSARARPCARFINARSTREIVFVRGTTEAINLVANSWGRGHLRRRR